MVAVDSHKTLLRPNYLAPAAYAAGVAVSIAAYYGFHIVFFGHA